jgi:hypothetical protein
LKGSAVTLLPLLAALGSGCTAAAADHDIHLNDYRTTCAQDSDCMPIEVGSVCGCCDCPSGAINVSDSQKYQSDFSADRLACSSQVCNFACVSCPGVAACVGGECTIVTAAVDGGAD